jgi:hypothetical protein
LGEVWADFGKGVGVFWEMWWPILGDVWADFGKGVGVFWERCNKLMRPLKKETFTEAP